MIDYQRLGDAMIGDLLEIESKIIDGEPDSIQEPIGILNVNSNTRSDAPAMSVDDMIDLFNEFPKIRPPWMYRPGPGPIVIDRKSIPFPTSIA